ncbi:hypothetical protein CCHR01_13099 [Colletotrichum chrysophilum]|uniref:Uncharacterized protein n=1 Tax=Colletotrichum chrysophilum TaxID=1836956 RepID=A0AAD9EDG5_9PEZI|nr:hypothetical protein CCHR01_13099 [Colletotrichum chrysophilum]
MTGDDQQGVDWSFLEDRAEAAIQRLIETTSVTRAGRRSQPVAVVPVGDEFEGLPFNAKDRVDRNETRATRLKEWQNSHKRDGVVRMMEDKAHMSSVVRSYPGTETALNDASRASRVAAMVPAAVTTTTAMRPRAPSG